MKTLTKALVGTVAAGTMAVSASTPALAKHGGGGISTGEAIAGALVIGGIAAVAASSGKDRYGYDRDRYRNRGHRYGHGYGYGYGMHPDAAVQRCVNAVERDATGYHYGRADVTRITSVKHKSSGFDVKGYVQVHSNHRGGGHRYYDSGTFRCKIRYGRISDIDFSGIRGLH